MSKAKRHRRPNRAKNAGHARRFLRSLPKQVEELAAVQQAAEFIDEREEEARRTALEIEKTVKAQLVTAVKYFDGWLEKLGLMRLSAHEEQLRRAKAKKTQKSSGKKHTKSGGAIATA